MVCMDVGYDEEPHDFIIGLEMLNSSGEIRVSMDLDFFKGSIQHQDMPLHGAMAKLSNAVLALFWSGDTPLLGTLTVSLPDGGSSPLLGDRDRQMGLILGSHIAKETGVMALVSVHLPAGVGQDVGRSLLVLVRDLLERLGKDE